jgi:membrane protease YdiL (CAAX protease family)
MILKFLEVAGKIILTLVLMVILLAVSTVPLIVIGMLLGGPMGVDQFLDQPLVESAFLIISSLMTIIAVLLMYYIFDRKRGLSLGWVQNNRWRAGLEGSVWGICFITASFLAIWLFGGINVVGIDLGREVLQGILSAVVLFILVAIGEELLCRGYWYGLIHRYFGALMAIIATSVLFAALHLYNDHILQSPVPVINLLLAGLLFGVAREVTNGLWVPIGIHFTWNLFQGHIFGFAVSGLDIPGSVIRIETTGHHLISGGGFGAEGSLLTGALIIAFTILIFWWYGKRGKTI